MKNFKKNIQLLNISNGFTLIELLLYISIASILLLGISFFLFIFLESKIKNQVIAEVEQQGLQAMQLITQTTRNAEAIILPTQGASSSFLTLNVVSVTNDPTIFDFSSGVFRIKEGNNPIVSLTNSHVIVSNLVFQNFSRANTPGTIRIQFTLTYANSSGRNEYNFSKTFIESATLH